MERLTVAPVINGTERSEWDRLAEDMSDTLRLSLALSGNVDLVPFPAEIEDPYSLSGLRGLREFTRQRRLDGAVIGRLRPGDGSQLELELSVWSPQRGGIVASETRTAFGDFDVLDAADELVVVAISEILGYQVDFGALRLELPDSFPPYQVRIDGVPLSGDAPRTVARVLTGRRTVEVVAATATGSRLVYTREHIIRTGEVTTVEVSRPRLSEREILQIRERHRFAEQNLGQIDQTSAVFAALEEA